MAWQRVLNNRPSHSLWSHSGVGSFNPYKQLEEWRINTAQTFYLDRYTWGHPFIRPVATGTSNTYWSPLARLRGPHFIEATMGSYTTSGNSDTALVVGARPTAAGGLPNSMCGAAITFWSTFVYLQEINGSAWAANKANVNVGWQAQARERFRVELRGTILRVYRNSEFVVEWNLASYSWTNGVPSSTNANYVGLYTYATGVGWGQIRYGALDAGYSALSGVGRRGVVPEPIYPIDHYTYPRKRGQWLSSSRYAIDAQSTRVNGTDHGVHVYSGTPSFDSYTLSGWVYVRSLKGTSSTRAVLAYGANSFVRYAQLAWLSGSNAFSLENDFGTRDDFDAAPVAGQWAFVVLQGNGSTYTGYWSPRNAGIWYSASVAYSNTSTSSPDAVLGGVWTTWQDADVRDFRAWNRVLSLAELQTEKQSVSAASERDLLWDIPGHGAGKTKGSSSGRPVFIGSPSYRFLDANNYWRWVTMDDPHPAPSVRPLFVQLPKRSWNAAEVTAAVDSIPVTGIHGLHVSGDLFNATTWRTFIMPNGRSTFTYGGSGDDALITRELFLPPFTIEAVWQKGTQVQWAADFVIYAVGAKEGTPNAQRIRRVGISYQRDSDTGNPELYAIHWYDGDFNDTAQLLVADAALPVPASNSVFRLQVHGGDRISFFVDGRRIYSGLFHNGLWDQTKITRHGAVGMRNAYTVTGYSGFSSFRVLTDSYSGSILEAPVWMPDITTSLAVAIPAANLVLTGLQPIAKTARIGILSVSATRLYEGLTGVVITGYGFGATQGTSKVMVDGVTQTVTSWGNTSITFNVVAPSGYASPRTLQVQRSY